MGAPRRDVYMVYFLAVLGCPEVVLVDVYESLWEIVELGDKLTDI